MSLKKQAVRGLKWTTTASAVSAFLQLLQLLVLARLLSKEDFGLMALVMVLVGLAQIFADMGVTNAIIYKKDITKQQLHTVYFINIGIGIVLYFALFLTAPAVSAFYQHPELTAIIRWVALIFVIQPFGQVYNALLRKELQFSAIAQRDMIVKAISFCVSVTMAMHGFGVYSFVGAQLICAVTSAILLILLGRKLYLPRLYISKTDIKPFIRFGFYQMGDQLVSFFRTQFDILLIGKLMSIELAGLYNVTKRLIEYPIVIINPIITQVSFPVMAKVQDDSLRLKNIFLKAISYISAINFPIYAFVALFAQSLIVITVGQQWQEAAPIVQILCIYGVLRAAINPIGSLLLAKGAVHRSFYWNLACMIVMPSFQYFAAIWGIKGIAWGTSISYIVILIPMWYFLVRPCIPCKLREYLSQFTRPLYMTTILSLPLLPIAIGLTNPIMQLAVGAFVVLLAFIPISKFTNPLFYDELMLQLKEAWEKHIKREKS